MTLTNLLVPSFTQMLKTLVGWLEKAQAQLPDGDAQALLSARLAPDMFPLSSQIRFACVQACEAVCRLTGEPFPPLHEELLSEGRNAADQPGSLQEAEARIAQTLAMLDGIAPGGLDAEAGRTIAHALPNGMIFDLTAEQYARDWTLPQFYFHLMTAYAILRAEQVELGKADYVPHMFQYLRAEPIPAA